MEQSVTYQAIVRKGREEGRAEEARRMVLLAGEAKFGPPDAAAKAAIEGIEDLVRLEELAVRLLNVDRWQELLPPPAPRRRTPRRRPQ